MQQFRAGVAPAKLILFAGAFVAHGAWAAASSAPDRAIEAAAACPESASPHVTVRFDDADAHSIGLEELPLDVPSGAVAAVSVCNWGAGAGDVELKGVIGSVGKDGQVRVDIINSWNVDVDSELRLVVEGHGQSDDGDADGATLLLQRQGRWRRTRRLAAPGPSAPLLPALVLGPLAEGAEVSVLCRGSGNVRLAATGAALRIEGAAFVGKDAADDIDDDDIAGGALLGGPLVSTGGNLSRGLVEIDVADSGNVIVAHQGGGGGPHSTVSLRGAALVGSLLAGKGLSNSTVRLRLGNVGNIVGGAGEVSVRRGKLLESPLRIGSGGLRRTRASLRLRGAGGIAGAGRVVVARGELVGEPVDCDGDVEVGSELDVDTEELGNVDAGSLDMRSAELLDEVIDAKDLRDSRATIVLRRSADAVAEAESGKASGGAGGVVEVSKGELLDEVVDSKDILRSSVALKETDVANVDSHRLRLRGGAALADESIDASAVRHSMLRAILAHVGSFRGQDLELGDGSKLTDEALDAKVAAENSVVVALSHVGEHERHRQ